MAVRLCMGLEHTCVSKANNAEMRGLGNICVSHAKYKFVANKTYMNDNQQVDTTEINNKQFPDAFNRFSKKDSKTTEFYKITGKIKVRTTNHSLMAFKTNMINKKVIHTGKNDLIIILACILLDPCRDAWLRKSLCVSEWP